MDFSFHSFAPTTFHLLSLSANESPALQVSHSPPETQKNAMVQIIVQEKGKWTSAISICFNSDSYKPSMKFHLGVLSWDEYSFCVFAHNWQSSFQIEWRLQSRCSSRFLFVLKMEIIADRIHDPEQRCWSLWNLRTHLIFVSLLNSHEKHLVITHSPFI